MKSRRMMRRAAVVLAVAACALGSAGASWAATSWDVAADFGTTANPSGAWTYGWSPTVGGAFTAMTTQLPFPGITAWSGPPGWPWVPVIDYNETASAISPACCNPIPPHSVIVHPGAGGQVAVIRWTAPTAGTYDVSATWTGGDFYFGGTDAHLLRNGSPIFNAQVVGYLGTRTYSGTIAAKAGDMLDFATGFGADGNYSSDTTRIAITITEADATPPEVVPTLTGTLGDNGWYTSNVHVAWSVRDPDSAIGSSSGCGPADVTTDTTSAGVTFTCAATSAGGTTEKSVTVRRDATPPAIEFTGNQGSYGLLDDVAIACTASDQSSGLATDPCSGFSLAGLAWSFAPANTLPQPGLVAIDNAGNESGPAQTSFTVSATYEDLAALTRQLVVSRDPGEAQRPVQKLIQAQQAAASGNLRRKAEKLRQYGDALTQLARKGELTQAQADALAAWAATL